MERSMFFFKKKSITVDAFTYLPHVYEFFEIKKAIECAPNWWKVLPNTYDESRKQGLFFPVSTLKRCQGFVELYKTGFIMPMWTDVIIETHESGQYTYQAADGTDFIITHNSKQFGETIRQFHIHMKFNSPWLLSEKTGVKFLWTEPTWNNVLPNVGIRVLPGIVEYKYQGSTHVNMFVPKKTQRIEIGANDPLVHIIPVSDNDVTLKNHLVDDKEYIKIRSKSQGVFFLKKYEKIKEIQDNKEKKSCPFKF